MKFKCEITMTNATINPEKAGGDDGEIGSALRFDGDVLVDKLGGLFSSEDAHKSLVTALYGTGHDLIAHDLSEIKLGLELEKVKAVLGGPILEDERLSFTGCRLNSVSLEPKHGRAVGVTLKLYVHPSETQWAQIVALVRKTVSLNLSGGSAVEREEEQQPSLLQSDGAGEPTPATAQPVH